MRIPALVVLLIATIQSAGAADMSRSFHPLPVVEKDVILVRPMQRVVRKASVCVRCSRLPLGGLREPTVAHVPLGGLRSSCPPVAVETVRERVVLRVKG